MKCQKCGLNEVNFYYSSSVNGAVTETHLCSECARGAGYDINSIFGSKMLGFGDMFDGLMPLFSGGRLSSGLMSRDLLQEGMGFPQFAIYPIGMPEAKGAKCGCSNAVAENVDAKADDEMSERRKLNMEMRAAVEKEDFEKAAELRDRIKGLEAQ